MEKKRTINHILEARKKSLQLIKAASFNFNDSISMFSRTSAKKFQATQSNHGRKFTPMTNSFSFSNSTSLSR